MWNPLAKTELKKILQLSQKKQKILTDFSLFKWILIKKLENSSNTHNITFKTRNNTCVHHISACDKAETIQV